MNAIELVSQVIASAGSLSMVVIAYHQVLKIGPRQLAIDLSVKDNGERIKENGQRVSLVEQRINQVSDRVNQNSVDLSSLKTSYEVCAVDAF